MKGLYRDGKRVLECLQRALRVADACMDAGVSVELFVEILNQYVYYFDQENEAVSTPERGEGNPSARALVGEASSLGVLWAFVGSERLMTGRSRRNTSTGLSSSSIRMRLAQVAVMQREAQVRARWSSRGGTSSGLWTISKGGSMRGSLRRRRGELDGALSFVNGERSVRGCAAGLGEACQGGGLCMYLRRHRKVRND